MSKRERDRRLRKARRSAISWFFLAVALFIVFILVASRPRERVEVSPTVPSPVILTPDPSVIPSLNDEGKHEIELDEYGMTSDEWYTVHCVVTAEAHGESFLGMMAVAQCIRETAEARNMTPYEVATEVINGVPQYAPPADFSTADIREACEAVFWDGACAVDEPIQYFYAPAKCDSEWHETALVYVCTIGGHRFFKEAENG